MQVAPGCFGSVVAFATQSQTCLMCDHRVQCKERVSKVKPLVLKLIEKFTDDDNSPMIDDWLTRGERRDRRKAATSEIRTALMDNVNARAAPIVESFIRQSIDPRDCSVDELAAGSPHMRIVCEWLRIQRAHVKDLRLALTEVLSPRSAADKLRDILSLLKACGRVRIHNDYVELV